MKRSARLDLICIDKILKYIQTMLNAYFTYQINSADDLANNDLCQLAITQIITNIYELKLKIREETLAQTPLFAKIGLKAARNIASHDYDGLDFDIIYRRTIQLTRQEISDELEAVRNVVRQGDSSNPQS
ncbi:MAG: hypothetical protein FWH17_09035 [Oscillospiraceae bacterium]|nr:hypothetical protein [Oscillospiraceae bacterium]